VRIINHIPELTRLKPLDPQSRRTDRPKDDVGIIRGTLSTDRMTPPYHHRLIINARGIAMHIAIKVEVKATMMEVKVALSTKSK
jgi:hypothetical protein